MSFANCFLHRYGEDCGNCLRNLVHLHHCPGDFSSNRDLRGDGKHYAHVINCYPNWWPHLYFLCNPQKQQEDLGRHSQFATGNAFQKREKGLPGHDYVHRSNPVVDSTNTAAFESGTKYHYKQHSVSLGEYDHSFCIFFQPSCSDLEECHTKASLKSGHPN